MVLDDTARWSEEDWRRLVAVTERIIKTNADTIRQFRVMAGEEGRNG